tara:strand:- start:34136 stop:34336 length:201 start_codon:yes stop_codon:yes gene_type:complete
MLTKQVHKIFGLHVIWAHFTMPLPVVAHLGRVRASAIQAVEISFSIKIILVKWKKLKINLNEGGCS